MFQSAVSQEYNGKIYHCTCRKSTNAKDELMRNNNKNFQSMQLQCQGLYYLSTYI